MLHLISWRGVLREILVFKKCFTFIKFGVQIIHLLFGFSAVNLSAEPLHLQLVLQLNALSVFLFDIFYIVQNYNWMNIHKSVHRDIIMNATNEMQLYRLIYYSKSALHVSADIFVHHREQLTIYSIW
jgi:hypothetical protein